MFKALEKMILKIGILQTLLFINFLSQTIIINRIIKISNDVNEIKIELTKIEKDNLENKEKPLIHKGGL